jgi:D-alanyl-D-alanine carboxypeptidase/D-alanyl-D-alanine-endopeptidase (penicillin-binding protein 4)
MYRYLPLIIVLAALAGGSRAASNMLPPPIEVALRTVGLPAEAVSVLIQEAAAERPVVAVNAERPMNPASVMKLVTTYAGLEMLGPAYTWKTDAYATGPIRDGVLEGDLVIRGGGDPKLTLENFWLLLRAIQSRGVREIRGDLVLDRSLFGIESGDPGRFDNEPLQVYNTLPDALLVNFKALKLTFVPESDARRVTIIAEPSMVEIQVTNNLVLDNAPCGDWRARVRAEIRVDDNNARFAFAGNYSRQCGEQVRFFNVLAPTVYAGGLFRQMWAELGGRFSGNVRDGFAPGNVKPIVSHESPALSDVVRDVNKFSNNAMARQLYLSLGAAAFGGPATPEKSDRALRQWLAQKRLAMPDLVIENGSGLSRIERVSARSLGAMLAVAWRSPVMPEFLASMPIVGVDGTLRRRGKPLSFAGQAHIKGGTINAVRTMAGYVLDATGRRWIAVCLINHPKVHNANAHAVFDALMQFVYTRGGTLPQLATEQTLPTD